MFGGRKCIAVIAALLTGSGRAAADEPEVVGVIESRGYVGKDQGRGHLIAVPSARMFLPVLGMRLTAAADLVIDRGDGDTSFAWTSPYVGISSKICSALGELELGATIPLGAPDQRAGAALGLGKKLVGGEGFTRFRTDEAAVLITQRSAFGHYPLHLASEVSIGAALPVRDAGELGVPLQASLEATWRLAKLAVGLRTTMTAALASQDLQVASFPTLQVPMGSVRLGVSATVNLGGALGSTFSGAPWAIGLSLELPAQGTARGRLGQCDHDSDCSSGYVCLFVAACDKCEGGAMRCMKGR